MESVVVVVLFAVIVFITGDGVIVRFTVRLTPLVTVDVIVLVVLFGLDDGRIVSCEVKQRV